MKLEQKGTREKKAKDIPWGTQLANTARRTRETLIKGDGEREVQEMGEEPGECCAKKGDALRKMGLSTLSPRVQRHQRRTRLRRPVFGNPEVTFKRSFQKAVRKGD